LGRIISFYFLSFIILLALFPLFHKVDANEVNAVRLDIEARELERKAEVETDNSIKEELLIIAQRKRESARLEREKHFNFPGEFIINPVIPREIDKTFPKPRNTNLGGVFEISLGLGSGIFNPTPGGEYLTDPYVSAFAGTNFVPRTAIPYDNIYYINSQESPRGYAFHPLNFRINYFSEDLKYGFGLEERSFVKDTSYNAYSTSNPGRFDNAFQSSEYRWSETKLNFFYRDNWSHDKTLTMIWGIRAQSSEVSETALLPNIPGYFNYNEISYTIGPNLGVNYSQNFLSSFVFTAGIELTVGIGGLEYDRQIYRSGAGRFREFYSDVGTTDPIQLLTVGSEFYTKYDFLLNEQNRFGIKLNYMDFRRQTSSESFPRIYTNSVDNFVSEFYRFYTRNLIYNEESKRMGENRKHIFRWISLEYTYVF
jgi:hypothetical protein